MIADRDGSRMESSATVSSFDHAGLEFADRDGALPVSARYCA